MASQSEENYLKALFNLNLQNEAISVSDLGNILKVSNPSVHNMVKRLASQGYVKYQKYQPLKLTSKGKKQAAIIIRKHRLTEMYLVEKMGFGWEEVHDIAEQVEHINAPNLFEKMDALLNHPKVDPHGSPIPSKQGEILDNNFKALSEFKENDQVIIKALSNSSKQFLTYLNEHSISLGTKVSIDHLETFDGSMSVHIDNKHKHILSKSVCDMLLVDHIN